MASRESEATRRAAPQRVALRPDEAAEALGVSPRTLRRWMRDAGLPYLRLDGVVLIPCNGLEAWIGERVASERRTDALAAEILEDLSKRG